MKAKFMNDYKRICNVIENTRLISERIEKLEKRLLK